MRNLNCSRKEDVELPNDEFRDNITYLYTSQNEPESTSSLNFDFGAIIEKPDEKVSNNNIAEYTITVPPKINTYFVGLGRGYNIGYASAIKDVKSMVEEMANMSTESELSELRRTILVGNQSLLTNISDIKERIAIVETQMKFVSDGVREIKDNTKELPGINVKINELWEGKKWWKQYLLSPIITGIVVGAIIIIIKCIFHV
jgi:hypothetical protein